MTRLTENHKLYSNHGTAKLLLGWRIFTATQARSNNPCNDIATKLIKVRI